VDSPNGLTLDRLLLPELLGNLGYATHMLGKWHLGHCNEAYLPEQRGFDTHLGLWTANSDYFNKGTVTNPPLYDYHRGNELEIDPDDVYTPLLYAQEFRRIVESHDPEEGPFFAWIAPQNPHFPLQAPDVYLDMYPNIPSNDSRKAYSGRMISE